MLLVAGMKECIQSCGWETRREVQVKGQRIRWEENTKMDL